MSKEILILAPFYPPNIGGAETFAEGLAEYLAKDNFVTVLAFKSFDGRSQLFEPIPHNSVDDNVKGYLSVKQIDWPFKMGKVWKGVGIRNFFAIVPKMLWEAIKVCRIIKPDIVLCNGLNSSLIGALLKVLFKFRVGCILLALYGFKEKIGIIGRVAGRVLKSMDKVFVEGESGKQDIMPLGIDEDKIVKFQHWVDQEVFKPIKANKPNNERKLRVLFVGRPIREKGIHIIKTVENASKGEINFEYIENIAYESLAGHYQMADVLVVPSLYAEGFVRVVAEASSCGCAVIASNKGSLPELVEPFGFSIPCDSFNFDFAINGLHKNRLILKEYKNKAFKYAKENFSEKNAEVFLSIFS